jgi:predicted phosphodiesterase
VRRLAGLPYVPFWSRLRRRIQHLVPHVARFESAALAEARRARVQGVICGHLHIPALKAEGQVVYANTGDWVDSCTAIREDHSGRLALLDCTTVPGRVEHSEVRHGMVAPALPIAG